MDREERQPSIEQFENNLWDKLDEFDQSRPIWLENESRSIGSIYLPDGFWEAMKSSALINIEIPEERRIENLVSVYSLDNKDELCTAFGKIKKRLGHQRHDVAVELVQQGKFAEAVTLALEYYDKSYFCLLYTSPSPRDATLSRMPSSA